MTGLHESFSGSCEKTTMKKMITTVVWKYHMDKPQMINTLFYIDSLIMTWSAQYKPYHIGRKRGKGAINGV